MSKLNDDLSELAYVNEKVALLAKAECNPDSWRDLTQQWKSFLNLNSSVKSDRAQQILDDVLSNESILTALGAATQLYFIRGESTPVTIITMLQLGPVNHMRDRSYAYRSEIEKELMRVQRIKDTKKQLIGLFSAAIVLLLFASSNIGSRIISDVISFSQILFGSSGSNSTETNETLVEWV